MKLEIEYPNEFDKATELIADTQGIRVKAKVRRNGVAVIDSIELKEGHTTVYGEAVSSAFTLLQRHDSVDHVEFVTRDNIQPGESDE